MRKLLLLLPLLLLSACLTDQVATTTQTSLLASCTAYYGALGTINALIQQNKLSEQVLQTVDSAEALVTPICSAKPEPTLDALTQIAFDNAQSLIVNLAGK